MRSNTILPVLLAHLALCTPLPIVLEDDMQAALLSSPAQHPPAPIGTRPGQLRPQLFVSGGAPEDIAQKPFDNQPITPSTTDQPSSVLASPQPIETKWLLALTGPTPAPSSSASSTATLVAVSDEMADPEEEAKYVAAMIAELELSRGVMTPSSLEPSSSRLESPCHYAAYLSREYRDMLVISLFVTFVVVIVLAEMWETVMESRRSAAAASSVHAEAALEEGEKPVGRRGRKWRIADLRMWRRVRQLLGHEGAIRLEGDEAPAHPQAISIRASSSVPVTAASRTSTSTETIEKRDEKTELLL